MKILLAEDSGFMRIAMERILAKAGHNVITVEDGQRAVCVARENVPDFILLDMMLPKLTGPEVLEALKQDSTTKHIQKCPDEKRPDCAERLRAGQF
jgi:CheY-like chemotaxis protein